MQCPHCGEEITTVKSVVIADVITTWALGATGVVGEQVGEVEVGDEFEEGCHGITYTCPECGEELEEDFQRKPGKEVILSDRLPDEEDEG